MIMTNAVFSCLLSSLVSWGYATPITPIMQEEMQRGLTELTIEDQPRPYWISIQTTDKQSVMTVASNGSILQEKDDRTRRAIIDLRVGTPDFDNRNFDASSYNGMERVSLPIDNDSIAIKRELWLGLDSAYKDAIEGYSEKVSAWEGREYPKSIEMLPLTNIVSLPEQSLPTTENWTTDYATQVSSVFSEYPFLDSNEVFVYHADYVKTLINTEGHQVSETFSQIVVAIEVTARAEDGTPMHTYRHWMEPNRESLPNINTIEEEARQMAGWLQTLQTAPIEEDYLGPVIFTQQPSMELFRQLLLSQLSATPPPSQMPDYDGTIPRVNPTARVGRRLLPLGWTVQDVTPAHPEEFGFYQYDDEGIAPVSTQLIDNGVVVNLLMSRIPRKNFDRSTGHGRADGLNRKVATPGVIEVRPKKHSSMRKLHKKGIQLAKQTGLDYVLVVQQIEPLCLTQNFEIAFSGDEQLSGLTVPTEVYRWYADGHTEPVRGLSFVGVDKKVLRDIVLAGEQGQFIATNDDIYNRYSVIPIDNIGTSWSTPSVLIGELELRGQGGQELRLLPPPPIDIATNIPTNQ